MLMNNGFTFKERLFNKLVRLAMPWQLRMMSSRLLNTLLSVGSNHDLTSTEPDLIEFLIDNEDLHCLLERDGVAIVGNIGEHLLSKIIDELKKLPIDDTIDEKTGLISKTMQWYRFQDLINQNQILSTALSPSLLSIARNYLKGEPKLVGLSAWQSFPSNDQINAQYFHRDLDGFKWLKVFIYLSNVQEKNGPFSYVLGSHKSNTHLRYCRLDDIEVKKSFSSNQIKNFTGPKGTVIIADTFGLHRGTPVLENSRLMLQFTLGTVKVPLTKYPKIKKFSSNSALSFFRTQ